MSLNNSRMLKTRDFQLRFAANFLAECPKRHVLTTRTESDAYCRKLQITHLILQVELSFNVIANDSAKIN